MGTQTIEATAWGRHTLNRLLLVGTIILMTPLNSRAVIESVPPNTNSTPRWALADHPWLSAECGWLACMDQPSGVPNGIPKFSTPEAACRYWLNAPASAATTVQNSSMYTYLGVTLDGIGDNAMSARCLLQRIGDGNTVFTMAYSYTPRPTCPDNSYTFKPLTGMCERDVQESYTLKLTGDTQTEPSQPLSFVATIIDKATQQPPTKEVAVKISLAVDDTSGGHDHGDSSRPRGSLNGEACASDDTCITLTAKAGSGTAPFTFTPRDASGKHTITASCDKCGSGDSKTVEVKVEGLMQIPDEIIRYAQFDSDGAIGAVLNTHENNHYLTADSILKLNKLAGVYAEVNPGFRLFLNDASLEWGGLFDVGSTRWKKPHKTHRRGKSLDIRAASAAGRQGEVPASKFMKFINEAADNNLTVGLHCLDSTDTQYCLGQPNNRHFHADF